MSAIPPLLVTRAVCLRHARAACSLDRHLHMSDPWGLHLRHGGILLCPRGNDNLRLPLVLGLLWWLHLGRHWRILLAHGSGHAGLWRQLILLWL